MKTFIITCISLLLCLSLQAQKTVELKRTVTAAQFQTIYLNAVKPCLDFYQQKTLPTMQKRIKKLKVEVPLLQARIDKSKKGSKSRAKLLLQQKQLKQEFKALQIKHRAFTFFEKELKANAAKKYKVQQKWLKKRILASKKYKKLTNTTLNFFTEYQQASGKFISLPTEKDED